MIAYLQIAARTGVVVDAVENDASGQLSIDDLRDRLAAQNTGPVRLIAITHVPTQGGLVNPAKHVGQLAREYGVPYLDACPSVGQMDVTDIGCDFLTATGRKFLRGPRRTGFAYIRRDLIASLEPPFLDLHAATWTTPTPTRSGAMRAGSRTGKPTSPARSASASPPPTRRAWGLPEIQRRVDLRARTLRHQLTERSDIHVHDQGPAACGIVTFTIDGIDPQTIQYRLSAHHINTSVSVIKYARLDLEARALPALVRACVH